MSFFSDLWLTRKPLAGFIVIGMAWSVYFAQMPVIKAAIGASDGVYGSVVLFASLGAIAAMWLAPLADRLAGRWAMPGAALIVAAGMQLSGLSQGLVVFALAMTLASVGSGIVDVLVNVRVSELEEMSGRTLMNLNHAMYSFTYAFAALFTGVLREWMWTPTAIFALMSVGIIGLCCVMIGPRPVVPAGPAVAPKVSLPAALIWSGGLLVLAAFLTEAASEGWSALHLERTLGGGPAEGALGPAILGLTMGIGRLGGHFVTRNIPDFTLMGLASLSAATGLVIAGAAPGLVSAYLGFGLTGLGISVLAPLAIARVGRSVPREARLAAISRNQSWDTGPFSSGLRSWG